MKKILAICLFFQIFILDSCKKDYVLPPANGISTSDNQNFKVGETGVTLAIAQKIALKFIRDQISKSSLTAATAAGISNSDISIKNSLTIVSGGKPYFHIVNTDKGFVILSSDSLYRPILAYDPSNNFSVDYFNSVPGLLMWVNKHASQLDFVRSTKNKYADSIGKENKLLWTAIGASNSKILADTGVNNSRTTSVNTEVLGYANVLISSVPVSYQVASVVGPLCTTQWGQVWPWNQYCPNDTKSTGAYSGRDPAGCVPVAMAQLMYYWRWPSRYGWTSMAKSADFTDVGNGGNPTLNPYTNPAGFTGSAQVMSDIGNSPGTFWTTMAHLFTSSKFAHYDASNTECDQEYSATIFNQFGYSTASTSQSIATQLVSGAANGVYYMGLLTNELLAGRPCLLGGYANRLSNGIFYGPDFNTGHTWVCDGANKTLYYSGTQNTYRTSTGEITVITQYPNLITIYLLHMNWGFRGTGDAWYDASTNYTLAPALNQNLQYYQTVTYNIHP